MKKVLSGIGLAAVLTLGPAGIASAQSDDVAEEVAGDDDSDKTGLWGLAGLAGLLGLAGLKRRDRRDDTYRRDTGVGSTSSQR